MSTSDLLQHCQPMTVLAHTSKHSGWVYQRRQWFKTSHRAVVKAMSQPAWLITGAATAPPARRPRVEPTSEVSAETQKKLLILLPGSVLKHSLDIRELQSAILRTLVTCKQGFRSGECGYIGDAGTQLQSNRTSSRQQDQGA